MPSIVKSYKEKMINQLTKDDDYVCIAGYPVLVKDKFAVIDDGYSTLTVYLNDNKLSDMARFVKIFGKVIEMDGILSMQADFLQDLSKIDTFLYNKVRGLLHD